MSTLVELREEKASLEKSIADLFGQYPNLDMPVETALEIREKNNRLTEVAQKVDGLLELDSIRQATVKQEARGLVLPFPASGPEAKGAEFKTVRQVLDEAEDYQRFLAAPDRFKTARFNLSRKTLLTLSDIDVPAFQRPGVVPSAQESRTVADLMLQGTTDNNTLQYYEETTFTNAAAEVAEGAEKPESALDFTLRTDPVQVIATWIPATRQLLADVSFMESYIRERLAFMVKRREETQLISGDGTDPNISGILDRSGIQTQAKGADSVPDAIYKAITKIRNTAFAEPTAVVIHPNDWQTIRLLTTTDGIYIWGPPMDAGPERIWGLPVRVTTGITENTALVGAFRPDAQVFRREDITITISTEHSDYFVKNKVAILAEERLALAVYRPASFCTVTGI